MKLKVQRHIFSERVNFLKINSFFGGDRLVLGERVCMTSKVTQQRSPFHRRGADPDSSSRLSREEERRAERVCIPPKQQVAGVSCQSSSWLHQPEPEEENRCGRRRQKIGKSAWHTTDQPMDSAESAK